MTQENLPFHDDTSRRIPAQYIEAGKYGLPKARAALAKAGALHAHKTER